jgi:hypothetical protein
MSRPIPLQRSLDLLNETSQVDAVKLEVELPALMMRTIPYNQ